MRTSGSLDVVVAEWSAAVPTHPSSSVIFVWIAFFAGTLTLAAEPTFDAKIVNTNITAVAGQNVILQCSIDKLGKYKVVWLDQNSFPLTYEDRRVIDDPRFSIVRPYIKEWNLHIREVRRTDSGQYRCSINTEPVTTRDFLLYVKAAPQIIGKFSSDDVIVTEGKSIRLTCNVTGEPHPEVTWYRRPLTTTNWPHDAEILETVDVLVLNYVSRDCGGIYECVANNGVPPAVSRQILVTVQFAPEVTVVERKLWKRRGEDAVLECDIVAQPIEDYFWERLAYRLRNNPGKYTLEVVDSLAGVNAVRYRLTIHRLEESDFGEYSCTANNRINKSRDSAIIYEQRENDQPTIASASSDNFRRTPLSPQREVNFLSEAAVKSLEKPNRLIDDRSRQQDGGTHSSARTPSSSSSLFLSAFLSIAILKTYVH